MGQTMIILRRLDVGDAATVRCSSSLLFAVALSGFVHVAILSVLSRQLPNPVDQLRSIASLKVELPLIEQSSAAPGNVREGVSAVNVNQTNAFHDIGIAESAGSAVLGKEYLPPGELDKLASLVEGTHDIELPAEASSAVPMLPARLLILIGADGLVDQVYVLSDSDYAFQVATLVRQWRFVPAEKDGHPVASRKLVEVSFEPTVTLK